VSGQREVNKNALLEVSGLSEYLVIVYNFSVGVSLLFYNY